MNITYLFSLKDPSQVNPPRLTKTVSSGRPALRVTWTAPLSDLPIIKYQVQYRMNGVSWSTKNVTSTSTTLENLSAGGSYQVSVRAVSDIGVGSYSVIRTIIGASLSEPHTYESAVCPPTLPVVVIGASLSEPHTYEFAVCPPTLPVWIYMYICIYIYMFVFYI